MFIVDYSCSFGELEELTMRSVPNLVTKHIQITNFHLPESTLVMLVSAFAGRENVLNAYNEAVRERYRFFSFGDAMFIQ